MSQNPRTRELTRREFIKLAAGMGVALAGGEWLRTQFVALDAPRAEASGGNGDGPFWAMSIDLGKCIGCERCVYACQATNNTHDDHLWNIIIPDAETFGKPVFVTRPCMHCEHAPCVEVCPVVATYHRPDGLVEMDYTRCIGCRYCMVACPYGVRVFEWEYNTYQDNPEDNPMVPDWGHPDAEILNDPKHHRPRGVAAKCTFCAHRLDRLEDNPELVPGVDRAVTPACCVICPVEARAFGDLRDLHSPVSRALEGRQAVTLRSELGTNPRVFYLLPM
jgi:Fe-S-cluster-containing dehydrogenase component